MGTMSRVVLVAMSVLASRAWAWPVDLIQPVDTFKDKFIKLNGLDWIDAEDSSIATAELLPGGELFLTGHRPGTTLLLLYHQGKAAVWRVDVVDPKLSSAGALAPPVDAVPSACPTVHWEEIDGERKITGSVPTESCRMALIKYFQKGSSRAKSLELTFEIAPLQSQLNAIEKALPPFLRSKVTFHYSGAGLVIDGQLRPDQHRRLLWEIFRQSVGRMALDDQTTEVEVNNEPRDSGAARIETR